MGVPKRDVEKPAVFDELDEIEKLYNEDEQKHTEDNMIEF